MPKRGHLRKNSNKKEHVTGFRWLSNSSHRSLGSKRMWTRGIIMLPFVGWMNIHLPSILMFTGVQDFDPWPFDALIAFAGSCWVWAGPRSRPVLLQQVRHLRLAEAAQLAEKGVNQIWSLHLGQCGCGCQHRFGIPFWSVGEFTTHFRTYVSGWIESDVHWGYDLDFDPRERSEREQSEPQKKRKGDDLCWALVVSFSRHQLSNFLPLL